MQNKPIAFAHICPYQYSVWWVNMPQWADSLFCLCTSVVRGEGGMQTPVSLLRLVICVHKDLCQHSRLSEPGNSQPSCKSSHGPPLTLAAVRTRGRNVLVSRHFCAGLVGAAGGPAARTTASVSALRDCAPACGWVLNHYFSHLRVQNVGFQMR